MKNNLKRKRPSKLLIIIAVVVIILTLLYSYFNVKIRPIILHMAAAKVENAASLEINKIVYEAMDNDADEFESLVTVETDVNGKVSALKASVIRINKLKTQITINLLEQIENKENLKVMIPAGAVIGIDQSSSVGPKFPVSIMLSHTVETRFASSFTSCGINQSRHQIFVEVKVPYYIVMPGKIYTGCICTAVLISDTVIIGDVPESYAYFGETESAEEAQENYYNFF